MIADPAPNTIARPYRALSVQEVDVALTDGALLDLLLRREVYRSTEYIVLRNGPATALAAVRRVDSGELFAPVAEARVLAGPDQVAWVHEPDTDVGNATALAAAARRHSRPGLRAWAVLGRFEHVNFIWEPAPLAIRVTEVVPPQPPKLLAMAEQVVAFDEDLPPVELTLDAVDLHRLAAANPVERYLLPCRGAGIALDGAEVRFLDERPDKQDWVLVGCARSREIHRWFYGTEPGAAVELCPRRLAAGQEGDGAVVLTKCCLLEEHLEVDGDRVTVPWGATLELVRAGLARAAAAAAPAWATA
ncbi:MAG TPA: hypothetical protein VFD04_21235 [Actinomycetes bacterium]|nr:hypothetical protein [Actinomycetes bacterium]